MFKNKKLERKTNKDTFGRKRRKEKEAGCSILNSKKINFNNETCLLYLRLKVRSSSSVVVTSMTPEIILLPPVGVLDIEFVLGLDGTSRYRSNT
jgi:hypothetical protein